MNIIERCFWHLPLPGSFLNWLWSFLPDHCEMPDCPRHGVRGNENRVDGKIMCDDCTVRYWKGVTP